MTLTLDDEVLREVWSGSVAVAFSLHPADVGTLEIPPPFYLALPRYAYLTMYSSEIRAHFAPYATALGKTAGHELWFTANDRNQSALRWTWPVGVLYDLYGAAHTPWPVTVHTSAYPSERLLRCPDEDTVKSHFLHSLKEAVFLRHGDVDVVNELSIAASTDLWAGILRNEMERYWAVNKQIAAHALKKPWRSVAVRIVRATSKSLQQEPIAPQGKDGRDVSLGMVLQQLVPEAVELVNSSSSSSDSHADHGLVRFRGGVRVIVQGITPALDTSMPWLATHLASADNFLYIVVLGSELS